MTPPAVTWPRLLATLLARENLTADDARWAMGEVMDDAHDPAQLAAFLQLPPTPSPLDSARYAQPSAAVAQLACSTAGLGSPTSSRSSDRHSALGQRAWWLSRWLGRGQRDR